LPRPVNAIVLAGLVLAAVIAPAAAVADAPAEPWNPRWYRCPRAATAPVIDGVLDDPAWAAAPATEPFIDIEGSARPVTPRFATTARMTWDEQHLYVAARLDEPHVWGTLTDRDAVIYMDNDFEVFIDPDGDNHLYWEFEINALGTEWDLLLPRPYRDGGPAVNGLDTAGLLTAARVDGTINDPSDTDRGWTVEMAIPWASLADLSGDRACPPGVGDTWRINFSRVQWEHRVENGRYVKTPIPGRGWKGEDNWVWSPQGLVAMHMPERWGFVTFVQDAADKIADPRPHWRDANELLMPLYYAQQTHRQEYGRYARRLADLAALPADVAGRLTTVGCDLQATEHTFTAAVVTGRGARWTVDHQGRLLQTK
jgi:hypothetical protein